MDSVSVAQDALNQVNAVFEAIKEANIEVHAPLGGHVFKVRADGFTEGFPAGAVVVNNMLPVQQRRASLLRQLVQAGRITDQEAADLI